MKRIFDPIHHFIELSTAEAKLLDTDVMQRMRRLRQLGLAYLAFPSAEHSRFGHALGAVAAGTRVFETLITHSREAFNDANIEYERRLLRAALLLHDIGHGPFSHACEDVLGVRHEARTEAILNLRRMRETLAALEVDPAEVLALILGNASGRHRVFGEIVSGPNLDADRMDYLLRDAYFTGVATGHYDSEQLFGSLRIYQDSGPAILGVDSRGVVALESFVLARYMMFATVYFHHTTRMYERILQDALRELWPQPSALDDIEEFLAWDDARVMTELEKLDSDAARALRGRIRVYAVAAEFNAERDLEVFQTCEAALRARWGDAVWADSQEQLMHRLPLGSDDRKPTVMVGIGDTLVDAREASDLIKRVSGRAYWRKLFVRRDQVDVAAAREVCRSIIKGRR
ncbi:MAG: HD domain-containing protein [Candidatus Eremiobacteraeota bacterium]|nr:HD domain-containing protein [Candidatus Eremiobacteraeota bacterium]